MTIAVLVIKAKKFRRPCLWVIISEKQLCLKNTFLKESRFWTLNWAFVPIKCVFPRLCLFRMCQLTKGGVSWLNYCDEMGIYESEIICASNSDLTFYKV